MPNKPNRTIKSVERACEVIEYLHKSGGGTISELAEGVGLSVGAVHTHLATLKQFGYIVQEGKTYKLGPQFLPLGEYVRNHSMLYKTAKEQINKLATETNESAHLIIEHNGRLYAMYERYGSDAVGVEYHTKKREESLTHLHCTAAGKAILAFSDRRKLSNVLDTHGLPELTANTITEVNAFDQELETIRERGVAFADEEQILGIRAVGAPIIDADDQVLGAIAVSGPKTRLTGDYYREELPEKVIYATNATELNYQTYNLDNNIV